MSGSLRSQHTRMGRSGVPKRILARIATVILATASAWWSSAACAGRPSLPGPNDPLCLIRQALVEQSDDICQAAVSLAAAQDGQPLKVALGPVTTLGAYRTNRSAGIQFLLKEIVVQAGLEVSASAQDLAPVMVGMRYRFIEGDTDGAGPATADRRPDVKELKISVNVGNRDGDNRTIEAIVAQQDVEPLRWDAMVDYMLGRNSPIPQVASRSGPGAVSSTPTPTEQAAVAPSPVEPASSVTALVPRYEMQIYARQGAEYVRQPRTIVEGQDLVNLQPGDAFAVELINNGDEDAAVQLSVDGVNVFRFSRYWGQYWFFVVRKHSRLMIHGWHRDNERSDAFQIGEYSKSVAARVLQKPEGVGTITAQFAAAWDDPAKRPADEPPGRGASRPTMAVLQGASVESRFEETHFYHGQDWRTISVGYRIAEARSQHAERPRLWAPIRFVAGPAEPQAADASAASSRMVKGLLSAPFNPPEHRWALLVAASDYASLVPFPSRHENMMAIKECLVKSGFLEDHVLVLSDRAQGGILPTRANIEEQLRWLRGERTDAARASGQTTLGKDDQVLVVMALYGIREGDRQFLCAQDSVIRKEPGQRLEGENLLPIEDVQGAMMACRASRKVLVLDVFREDPRPSARGRTGEGRVEDFDGLRLRPPKGYAELIGYDDRQTETQYVGAFLNTLLQGLQGQADQGGDQADRLVSMYELADYVERSGSISRRGNSVLKVTGQDFPIVEATGQSASRVVAPWETLVKMGDALEKHGLIDDAIDAYGRALEQIRQDAARTAVYAARAQAYLAKGDVDSAQGDHRRANRQMSLKLTRPAQLMRGPTVVATLQAGQTVTVTGFQGEYLGINGVNGDATYNGWLPKTAFLFQPTASSRPAAPQAYPGYDNQEESGGGYDAGDYEDGDYDYDE